jgi:hypothetical protein
MFMNGKCLVLFLLLFPVLPVFSQASFTINEYGAYYYNNEELIKIPTTANLCVVHSWEKYLIFNSSDTLFMLFYNTENGACSDLLLPGHIGHPEDSKPGFFPLKNSNDNILFYLNGTEYELDPVTLKTVRTYTWGKDENVYDVHGYLLDQKGVFIPWIKRYYMKNEEYKWGHFRFYCDTFYVDIILSSNISRYRDIYFSDFSNNQFVFFINDTNYGD